MMTKPIQIGVVGLGRIGHTTAAVGMALGMKVIAHDKYPDPALADYYCMRILKITSLSRADAKQLYPLLDGNRDILQQVKGRKERFACVLFRIFGWYNSGKIVEFMVNIKHLGKSKE